MVPCFVSYITFNRLGLTVRNLQSLLDNDEEFEMHIIDNNSKDGTWEFVQDLKDSRIKSRTRLPVNAGPIYAVNFNLSRRKPEQYFFSVDNDVHMKTRNWISRYMEVFDAFPEVGLLGVQRGSPYPNYIPPVIARYKGYVSYLELQNAFVGEKMDFVPGCCQCLRPELIKEIGYWSEENYYGDAELSPRVVHYTSFKAGFVTGIQIDMTQTLDCNECMGSKWCRLNRNEETCFTLRDKTYVNEKFAAKFRWKYEETFKELEAGERTAYCASIFDPESMKNHVYNREWALENFRYYIENAN